MIKHTLDKYFQKSLIIAFLFGLVNFCHSEEWENTKLHYFHVVESSFNGALEALSVGLSKEISKPIDLTFVVVGPTVSYKESGVSPEQRSLSDELIGRSLRIIIQKEKKLEKTKPNLITISLHRKTAFEIITILSKYLEVDSFQVSGNTIHFYRDYTIHITELDISEKLASILRREDVLVELPFNPEMFELSAHSNVIIVASFEAIPDTKLHRLRELEKSL